MALDKQEELEEMELYAWVGWNEFAPGELGLKQAQCPAGYIPMVAVKREKIEQFWVQAEAQAAIYGKRIFLARFQLVEVVRKTKDGQP